LSLLPPPTAGAALLDVGAATGVFVERARRHGWAASGVEPSAWAAAHARDTMGQPVVTGSLEDLTVESGSLGGVTMWEVIEHLPDPREVLEHIRRLLRADGFLALSTPDAGSTVAKLLGRRWPGWKKVPEHLYHFDRPTLRRLLHETGFVVSTMRYVPLVVTRGYLLDRVRDLTGFSVPGLLPKFDRTVPIQVNPYYDLFVLARPR
jgi:SAM-dependent methyltransferase